MAKRQNMLIAACFLFATHNFLLCTKYARWVLLTGLLFSVHSISPMSWNMFGCHPCFCSADKIGGVHWLLLSVLLHVRFCSIFKACMHYNSYICILSLSQCRNHQQLLHAISLVTEVVKEISLVRTSLEVSTSSGIKILFGLETSNCNIISVTTCAVGCTRLQQTWMLGNVLAHAPANNFNSSEPG